MASSGIPESNRLSTDVTPTHYDLTIKTDLEQISFEGKVEIDITINKNTDTIVLHSLDPLKVHSAALTSSALKTDSHLEAKSIDYSKEKETLTVVFPTSLNEGTTAKLGFTFSAPLDDSMMGFYRSAHTPDPESDAKENYCLTQFEPTGARKAFPCWDEPALKATFAFTQIHRKGTVSLANMNETESNPCDGKLPALFASDSKNGTGEWVCSKYATTPKVSTYLVAFANGKFEKIESEYTSPLTKRKVPLKVYATKENIKQCELLLECTARIVPVYEKIFDIPYDLPKLDTLIASDFDAGAMENWGLITGRTAIYLFDPKTSGLAARKLTTAVQSHEIAHQWFGNLVTMDWWDNLWLNEAFATLMGEVITIQELHPEWKPHTNFINQHLSRALTLDGLRSSHQIEVPCPDSNMVNQIFDGISYSKGASVLKMLANAVGEKAFLKGVSIYLKKHMYGNSVTRNLWEGITESSGIDVAKYMANWTNKIGFPVLTVEETSEGIKVRQNRFLSTADVKPEEDETIWWVPLEIKTVKDGKSSIDSKAYLESREATFPIKDAANAIYKLNAETCGVYRVNYPPQTLERLGKEAGRENSSFSVNDRIGLVDDAITLAKSGYAKTSGALALFGGMSNEQDNEVWSAITAGLTSLRSVWFEQDPAVLKSINEMTQKLTAPLAGKLGFDVSEQDDSATRDLRVTIIGAALSADEPKSLAEAQKRFASYLKDKNEDAIPGDLRSAIFNAVVRNGGQKEFDAMMNIYKKPPTQQHKVAAISALTATPSKESREQVFKMTLSEDVKTQDIMIFTGGAARYGPARRANWEFFRDNYDAYLKRFAGNFSFQRVVQSAVSSLSSFEDAKAVEDFYADKDTSSFKAPLAQGLDSIRSNAGWLERDSEDVAQFFKQK